MGALRRGVLRWIKPIHMRFRAQKLDLFFQVIGEKPAADSLLELGGGMGIAGEFLRLYASFSNVTIVNLRTDFDAPSDICVRKIVADGCALPFRSGAFDWVFSNAVIEHVGGWQRQKLFASETCRVGRKGYFVATPNKYFPIEPHTLLPLYQFLPPRFQHNVVRLSPGYMNQYKEINLLSRGQLQLLFPEAEVIKIGFPGIPNSLVAFYRAH